MPVLTTGGFGQRLWYRARRLRRSTRPSGLIPPFCAAFSYASVTITARLTISITAHFYKANQTALSIETMRLEKVATSAGNAILLGSSQTRADVFKSSISDISDTAVEQLAPLAGFLRCSTGTSIPKKIEVKDSQQITSSALKDAFTDDAVMDLTAFIESAGCNRSHRSRGGRFHNQEVSRSHRPGSLHQQRRH